MGARCDENGPGGGISAEPGRAKLITRDRSILDAALQYAGLGWSIIPASTDAAGRKKGAVRWKPFQIKLADEVQIGRWFAGEQYDMLAVITGPVSENLFIRDFDKQAAYDRWAESHEQLASAMPTAATKRGRHVYGFLSNSSSLDPNTTVIKMEDGEFRFARSMTVLPPSRHPQGARYEWIISPFDGDIPQVDPVVAGLVCLPTNLEKRDAIATNTSTNVQRPLKGDAIKRAAAYLNSIPAAIQGQHGDDATYVAACRCRDFGMSIEQAMPLMRDWNSKCLPPWDEDDLRHKVDNAYNYAKGHQGGKLMQTSTGHSAPPTDSLPDDPRPPWFNIAEVLEHPDYDTGMPPLSTGLNTLDTALNGGFRPESVYLLPGRTGSAKSTMAANIARRMTLNGDCVLLFKLEESVREVVYRIHAATAQVPIAALMNGGHLSKSFRERLSDAGSLIAELPLRISHDRNLDGILRIAARHVADGGRMMILDQLSMVETEGRNPFELASKISNTLRRLARDLAIPVLVICQINRAAAKRGATERLSIHDLRDSGFLENDAAAVILLDRVRKPDGPEYAGTEPIRYLELSIGKNRYGPITDPHDPPLQLLWWPQQCRIEDAAPIGEEEAV